MKQLEIVEENGTTRIKAITEELTKEDTVEDDVEDGYCDGCGEDFVDCECGCTDWGDFD